MRHLLLLILLLPIVTLAQSDDDTVIMIGETLILSIMADTRATATFSVDTPQYVSIQVQSESEAFDPVVWLLDSQDNLIAYNDNFNDDSDAYIDNLYLLPDSYRIVIDSFNGVSVGDVELILEETDPFIKTISETETTFGYNIRLPSDTNFRHIFEASEDTILTVTARDLSGSLDPFLTILDDEEHIIITNDDHQSSDFSLNLFDARLSEWQVPSDGTYIIEVRDFLGHAGQLELIVEILP